ncbi:hypothetical protein ACP3TC_04980 [Winslowiella sp. 2C04]|uniref:hypothetical protein n=1 Tax=Winslowiella sp. 2C04 TaxID=3416179 RepID=UPI003CEC9AB5
MAGLTKEQRAEREALKQKEIAGQDENEITGLPEVPEVPELIRMYRLAPSHSRGPVKADVHPNDVELWIDEGWLKESGEEA